MKNYIELPNGDKMPLVGLGTWMGDDPNEPELEEAVKEAIDAGYRHFDTAYKYKTEEPVGRAIQDCIKAGKVKREDLFIVTKLPFIAMSPDRVEKFIKLSLKNLQVDYIDLFLMHWPYGVQYINDTEVVPMKDGKVLYDLSTDLIGIWKEMEKQVVAGRARSIGISNFNESQVERIMKIAKIKPANQQIEVHAYFQQKPLRKVCEKYGITICAYGPIGSPGRNIAFRFGCSGAHNVPALFEDPVIRQISKAHNKTPSQVLLRFLIQLGIPVIPKSTNPGRLRENIDVFNFELTPEEMGQIEALDRGEQGRSFLRFAGSEVHPECPF